MRSSAIFMAIPFGVAKKTTSHVDKFSKVGALKTPGMSISKTSFIFLPS